MAMKLRLNATRIAQYRTPLLAVPVAELDFRRPWLRALDRASAGRLKRTVRAERFEAKAGSALSLTGCGELAAGRLLLLGMGNEVDAGPAYRLRTAAYRAGSWARERGLRRLAVAVVAPDGVELQQALRWTSEGVRLGAHRYSRKTGDRAPRPAPQSCSLLLPSDGLRRKPSIDRTLRDELAAAAAHCDGVELARELVDTPANELSPIQLAERAKELATRHGIGARVLGRREIERRGMQLLAAVGAGSRNEPRFIHLHYRPAGDRRGCLALVGKGVTFDSGGLSLKPPASQPDMKCDMAGAAAVLGVMEAAAARNLPWELHGVVPACENMPGGGAYRPGDVFGSLAGKTVEINNTDAEGRLILADALAFSRGLNPELTIDFATLTGACAVALGPYTAGLFCNDETWAGRIAAAARRAGEKVWRLPLERALLGQLKSPVADLRNTGARWGGAITAALFLQEFSGEGPWAHLDVAGPAFLDKAHGFYPKGGTGYGVLTLLELLAEP
jgi:leucyl aminopeptidase